SQSSSSKAPVPTYEKSLHEQFLNMYNTLLSLKNDRNKYINSKQVYQIYDDFLNLLHDLKISRKDEELKGMTLNLPNANDLLIDDIWQLVSLCFVTCGLIKFAPATYSSLSTVNKFLHHLRECQVYTLEDLEPIKLRLDEIRDIIASESNEDTEDVDMSGYGENDAQNMHKIEENLILRNKLNRCESLYKELEDNFRNIPSDLEQPYNKLISIRKSILNYFTNKKPSSDTHAQSSITPQPENQEFILGKIAQFKNELKEIESTRDLTDGKFHSKELENDEKSLNALQVVLNGLLDDCNNLLNDLSIQTDSTNLSTLFETSLSFADNEGFKSINKGFEGLYYKLIDLKSTLENLLITRRWTLRETDLYTYQKLLKGIDDERIQLNEKIKGLENSSATGITQHLRKNQILILYLLRRCYSLIYKLLESSEPVSESLQPIHNQLSTVRKCLLDLKRINGLNNLRELYPFQFKLASLDNLRSDGKFIINNQIPEGQGTLNALLAECFDIIHELKIELEEDDDEDDGTNNINGGNFTNSKVADHTDDEDINTDDEVEIKRNRYVGFHEADYDQDSESAYDDEDDISFNDSEYEGNDYY
ncbi:uncharacterized protein CANTADRAFT_42486, partial [Suhomyces tanzawaensis NRRL Y-17324]